MSFSQQISQHFKQVFFGGNWTSVNLKDTLAGINWQQAITKQGSCNTIAALTFHIHYYIDAVLKVLQGGKLDAHDKYSYDVPGIASEDDWKKLTDTLFEDAATFASLVEKLPEGKLNEVFEQEKYGNYFRNLHGIIEHTHYHMGQIVILKKLLQEKAG